jgi:hypothetical protein
VDKMAMNDTIYFNEGKKRYRYDRRKWVSDHVWSMLITAVNNGLTRKEFQKILGYATVCRTIINESEKKEELLKIFPENTWFWSPKIRPKNILEREKELKGLMPTLIKVKIPIEQWLDDSQWIETENKFQINDPREMRKIVRYFLDKGGRYVGIFRDFKYHSLPKRLQKEIKVEGKKTKIKGYYSERVVIFGELPYSEIERSNKILLDKYSQKRRKQLLFTF